MILSWALQFKAIRGAAIGHSGHAADGSQFIGIDVKIMDDIFREVESQHFSENQTAAIRFSTHGHYLYQSAFHLHSAFGYAVRLDQLAWEWVSIQRV